jgi:hypothetical protein
MTSYGKDTNPTDATNYIDWHNLKVERRVIAVSDTTYPEPLIISDDLRKFELAKRSQLVTREIGIRKVKMILNNKGLKRNQYFNKS